MRFCSPARVGPPLFSVALISAAALAYEILLMRLFSIIQWHHFAYMMISLALLGYGASGTFLALIRRWREEHFFAIYLVNAVLFGVGSVVCFLFAQAIPFNALEVLWDPRQSLWLILTFLLLFLPFFCAANCICLTFSQYSNQLHRIYCFDLFGAGLGAVGIIALLFLVLPATALQVIGALGLLSATLAWLECEIRPRWPVAVLLLAIVVLLSPIGGFSLQVSEYKGLSQALRVLNAEQIDQRSSPLAQLTVVKSPSVPFRHSPGLSLNSPMPIPAQLGLFTDADALSVLTRFDGKLEKLAHLDYQSSALAYHLLEQPTVLVLGAGGGTDVLQALYHHASRVDAVELNSQVVGLVNHEFAAHTGAIYELPKVTVHNKEARGFVAASSVRYDLIQVALLDSFGASSAGLYALSENYLYTVEAFSQYLQHLQAGGILSITRWTKTPPRDGLKILATAIRTLKKAGVSDPGQQLIMIRSWNTSTLLVKNGFFSKDEIDTLKAFCRERWFDPIFYAGMTKAEANRHNQLQEAWYYEAAVRLLGPASTKFVADYKFNIHPATDNRPYFSQFLKWTTLPELLRLRNRGGMPLLEWGYLILVATLVVAVLASVLFVLLPLWFSRRTKLHADGLHWRFIAYFAAIGTAFMFIEIAFIQKFILFLHHPLYAVSVVLCAFLVFAGLGSLMSARWRGKVSLLKITTAIAVLSILYVSLFPGLFNWLIQMPGEFKIPISVLLIAPLAFLMGIPFPLGLSLVSNRCASWIPWAWGINGCASVISAILATLLAVHFGFVFVVTVAALLYLLAAMVLREITRF
ncbi:MAG: SAM-dependent methyltransferase [Gammaproteobacteria bacterium]|nr:SAM-dependent methyltransferase [Gammaproteobacteria bacterium]